MLNNSEKPLPQHLPEERIGWYIVGILMICYTISFVDRQILSLLVGPIRRELAISDTKIGLLQGLSFSLLYTSVGIPLGRLADKSSRRNLICISVLTWSIFTAYCAFAKDFYSLFAARVGVGLGEAGLIPAAYSLIADYFRKETLGLAMSVFYMGAFIGSSLALLVGGTVNDAVSANQIIHLPLLGAIAAWRVTFLLVALPGILMVPVLRTLKEPVRKDLLKDRSGAESVLSVAQTAAELRKRWSSVTGISIAMGFQAICLYGFLAWAPTFFVRIHGWTSGQSGKVLGLIIAPMGIIGMFSGSWLFGRGLRKGIVNAPLWIILLSAAGTGVLLSSAFLLTNPKLAVAFICLGFPFIALSMAVPGAALQLILPNQIRAQGSALYIFVINLVGLGLGPLLPAVINDYLFRNEQMLGRSIAVTIAMAGVFMGCAILWTVRCFERDYFLSPRRFKAVGNA